MFWVFIHKRLQYWLLWRSDPSYGTSPACPPVVAALVWVVGSCRWWELTPALSCLPLSRPCSSPLACTLSIRWCGYHLLPAQLLLVFKGMEPNRNSLECGPCLQDASGLLLWTSSSFFFPEGWCTVCVTIEECWFASGHRYRRADQLTPWALSADTNRAELNLVVSQNMPTSLQTWSDGSFLLVGMPRRSPIESLKVSWEKPLPLRTK